MLKMQNISKSFFGVNVLNNVDFNVGKGEIHALLGENGAGKSTLMNILSGVHTRDCGTVEFDGNMLEHTTVKLSESAGIVFVHQELNLFNDLRVYENIFLCKEITNIFGSLKKKEMLQKTKELFSSFEVNINPNDFVSDLSTSEKQLVEIANALFVNAILFILDEPTTSLNNFEIEHLFGIIKRLKKMGKSFIFISHKMSEIFDISDRYTVLRDGNLIASSNISDVDSNAIVSLMVGKNYSDECSYEPRNIGDSILEITNLSGECFNNVSMDIKRGQIIGFTGLLGSGISEMFQTIFGILPIKSGTLKINGNIIDKNNIHRSMKNHIGMIPANRKENSIIQNFTILENSYISEHTLSAHKQHIFNKKEIKKYEKFKHMLNIKANNSSDLITLLSGGNQQKVIIARWLDTNADILIMDNPKQGIDVNAKSEIYKLIHELAKNGKTILVNTLEISEIQKIADLCIVFYNGAVNAILNRDNMSEKNVMSYATGASNVNEGEKRNV